jgi:hypothetical protein
LQFVVNVEETRQKIYGRIIMTEMFTMSTLIWFRLITSYCNTSGTVQLRTYKESRLVYRYNCIRGRSIINLFLCGDILYQSTEGGTIPWYSKHVGHDNSRQLHSYFPLRSNTATSLRRLPLKV